MKNVSGFVHQVVKLKKSFYHLPERLGLVFYTKKQCYHFSYRVSLKNTGSEVKIFSLVLPVPQDIEPHQKILSAPSFSLLPSAQLADRLYGNLYAVWQVRLDPAETKIFEESFEVEVLPRRAGMSLPHSSFEDYKNLQPEVRGKFCRLNPYISSDHPDILAFAQKIKGNCEDVFEVVRKLNEFTIQYLDYSNPIPGLYTSLESLEKRTVDCGGFDTFFVALCNALGIPARVVSGFWVGYKKSLMHAWAEWQAPDGTWIAVDPSVSQLFQRRRTANTARFGFVGSDRVTFSVGCHIPLLVDGGEVFTDILQNPFLSVGGGMKDVEVGVVCESKFLHAK